MAVFAIVVSGTVEVVLVPVPGALVDISVSLAVVVSGYLEVVLFVVDSCDFVAVSGDFRVVFGPIDFKVVVVFGVCDIGVVVGDLTVANVPGNLEVAVVPGDLEVVVNSGSLVVIRVVVGGKLVLAVVDSCTWVVVTTVVGVNVAIVATI